MLHNTYHDGNIDTDDHVLCSTPENVSKNCTFPKFTTIGPRTLREFMYNITKTRDSMSIDGSRLKKGEPGSIYMMLK